MDDNNDIDVFTSPVAHVGALSVRRALPQRGRRTIGAWCFADHMGPADVDETSGLEVGPHPHIGLHTVTWLTDGQALHRDSLGSEQVITAGELNLMTAGHGIAHAEEATGHYRGTLQGIQLWIAQDDTSRHGPSAFAHHDDLPRVDVGGGRLTVLVGDFHNVSSPALAESDLSGAELRLHGRSSLALNPAYEYGVIVLEGLIELKGRDLGPGTMGYLRPGHDSVEVTSRSPSTVIILGGVPLTTPLFMWWNFVARSRQEIDDAFDSWMSRDDRFAPVSTSLSRVDTSPPWWRTPPST